MEKATAQNKKEQLKEALKKMRSLLVAFSGGVDSAFLLAAAQEALGPRAVAATAVSAIFPNREQRQAKAFTVDRNISQVLFEFDGMEISPVSSNAPDRCYHCKLALCRALRDIARDKGMDYVVHGANVDDLDDYRPGLRATAQSGIHAPLMDAGLDKAEIRFLAREMDLAQWDKPAMACLASRIPYGTPITHQKLEMIEKAENFLADRGLKIFRVRHHGSVVRIEAGPKERQQLLNERLTRDIVTCFRSIGFCHIAVDLEAFSSGRMNRTLNSDAAEL